MRFCSSSGSSVGATHWPMLGKAEPAFFTRPCRKSNPGTSFAKFGMSDMATSSGGTTRAILRLVFGSGLGGISHALHLEPARLQQAGQAAGSDEVQRAHRHEQRLALGMPLRHLVGHRRIALVHQLDEVGLL